MESFHDYKWNTTSNIKGKRKHYDEEAQAMADEFDDWKKPRILNDVASSMSTTNSFTLHHTMMPFSKAPTAAKVSSVRTERSSFMDRNNSSDGMMEGEDVSMSQHEALTPSTQQEPDAQNFWSMLNLKEWRRSQESPHSSMNAQQEMKRMWRNSNASGDRDQSPHNNDLITSKSTRY